MRTLAVVSALVFASIGQAFAWGQEGHSIVAELAQRRLSPEAAAMVEQLLGKGHSLASVASWADDVRDQRPETYKWHFVDIPIDVSAYNHDRDCRNDPKAGDCIVAELGRLRNDLRCAPPDTRIEALKFAIHFLGDIHQPLHTVDELAGGNQIKVDVYMRGQTCTAKCEPEHTATNFHAAWDSVLIERMVWDWGAYVERLENGWLKSSEAAQESPEATQPVIDEGAIIKWAEETHSAASPVWNLRPADNVLDDRYLRDILPILDRQLGLAGLRLARFLNEAYAAKRCPVPIH